VIAEPRMLLLVTGAGIVAAEVLCYLGQVILRLVSGQAAQLLIPLAIRLIIFAVLGVRLTAGLEQLQAAIELLSSIMQ